jgi:peptidoglycan/xylan/chitin deacetylase (PgdA/CDA1 family)
MNDLQNNISEIEKLGVSSSQINYFMPAYEWYNQSISDWTAEMGLKLINNTSGTSSQADYTTPDTKNYLSSDEIYRRILNFETKSSTGLNGALLLTHVGVGEKRTDKFYDKLEMLITELQNKGYKFEKLK